MIDLDAALTYIKSNDTLTNLPILLYGHSWGGYAVTAILNDNDDITAVASLSARTTAVDGINRTDTAVMIIHGDEDEAISYVGASIIAHQDEITNPNVINKTYSTENHNGHNNLFLC